MNQEELKAIKTEVLGLGDQTKSYIFGTIQADGRMGWRFGGGVIDAQFMVRYLGRKLDEEFDRQLTKEPPKT